MIKDVFNNMKNWVKIIIGIVGLIIILIGTIVGAYYLKPQYYNDYFYNPVVERPKNTTIDFYNNKIFPIKTDVQIDLSLAKRGKLHSYFNEINIKTTELVKAEKLNKEYTNGETINKIMIYYYAICVGYNYNDATNTLIIHFGRLDMAEMKALYTIFYYFPDIKNVNLFYTTYIDVPVEVSINTKVSFLGIKKEILKQKESIEYVPVSVGYIQGITEEDYNARIDEFVKKVEEAQRYTPKGMTAQYIINILVSNFWSDFKWTLTGFRGDFLLKKFYHGE